MCECMYVSMYAGVLVQGSTLFWQRTKSVAKSGRKQLSCSNEFDFVPFTVFFFAFKAGNK